MAGDLGEPVPRVPRGIPSDSRLSIKDAKYVKKTYHPVTILFNICLVYVIRLTMHRGAIYKVFCLVDSIQTCE